MKTISASGDGSVEVLRSTVLFARLDDAALGDLAPRLKWIAIGGGEILFDEGDPGDSLYVLIHGRLEVFRREPRGGETRIALIRPGELAGEMALLSPENRSASVRALRDSVLVRLSRPSFEELIESQPTVVMAVTRLLVERLRVTSVQPAKQAACEVFAVVAARRDAPLRRLSEKLTEVLSTHGPVLHLDATRLDAELGKGTSAAAIGGQQHRRVVVWLDEQEKRYRFIVLQADAGDTRWTERCLRHADRLLFVVDGEGADPPARARRKWLGDSSRRRELILIHRDLVKTFSGGRKWLDAYAVEQLHHVRLGVAEDVERLGRFLTGRTVSLVLSGGAVRGFAQIGVIRAIQEAGIAIDLVCGTSSGAIVGATCALGWHHAKIAHEIRRRFVDTNQFDFTLPVLSVLGGKRMERAFYALYGDLDIEDLPIRFACVSTNLTRAEEVVHTRGAVKDAVRASATVPGITPPVVRDQDLLVDGGLMNNVPSDVALRLSHGRMIAVNATPAVDLFNASGSTNSSPLGLLVQRFDPRTTQRHPIIFDVLMRSVFVRAVEAAARARQQADVYIDLPVQRFGMFDTSAYPSLLRVGYEAAKIGLQGWGRHHGDLD